MTVADLLNAGGAAGALIGLIPLLYGIFHARLPMGIAGLVACALVGVIGMAANTGISILAALIVAGLMVYLMFRADQVKP